MLGRLAHVLVAQNSVRGLNGATYRCSANYNIKILTRSTKEYGDATTIGCRSASASALAGSGRSRKDGLQVAMFQRGDDSGGASEDEWQRNFLGVVVAA